MRSQRAGSITGTGSAQSLGGLGGLGVVVDQFEVHLLEVWSLDGEFGDFVEAMVGGPGDEFADVPGGGLGGQGKRAVGRAAGVGPGEGEVVEGEVGGRCPGDAGVGLHFAAEGVDVALEDDFAVFDHADLACEALGFVEVVGGEQDGCAAVGEAFDDLPGLAACGGVEACGGFVEEDEVGVADHAGGEVEAALLSAGEFVAAAVGVFGEADEFEGFVDVHGVFVEFGGEVEHFAWGEALAGGAALEDDADAAGEGVALAAGVEAEDGDGAFVAVAVALHDFDQGGFAGAVGSEQCVDLAGVDGEVDVVDGADGAVAFGESVDFDGRGHWGTIALRGCVFGVVRVWSDLFRVFGVGCGLLLSGRW